MKRILIATDETAASNEAVKRCGEALAAGPCQVRVLSVIPLFAPEAPGLQYDRAAESALAALDHALGLLERAGHHAEGVVRVGEPVAAIVEAARELAADLIIMGTRDPHHAGVARQLLAEAPCDVLIFPLQSAPC